MIFFKNKFIKMILKFKFEKNIDKKTSRIMF